jgi:hypothetical protein
VSNLLIFFLQKYVVRIFESASKLYGVNFRFLLKEIHIKKCNVVKPVNKETENSYEDKLMTKSKRIKTVTTKEWRLSE